MRWTIAPIGFLALTQMISLGHASPIRRVHHPWLAIHSSRDEVSEPLPVAGQSPDRSPEPRSSSSEKGKELSEQALRYKGTRYRFGGDSKKGMDCSGLVSRIYQDLQMKRVPRASASLYQSGRPVRLAELRPGDLVFFKNTYKRGISHVGVYAGNNRFVHAANHKKGVTVTSLADPYYQLHYAGARRLY